MSDLLRSNFDPEPVQAPDAQTDERAAFRKRALENISGSMVFVEDRMIYWDLENE